MAWPSSLESDRLTCLAGVVAARDRVQRAIGAAPDAESARIAASSAAAALRDCQRLLLAAADYRPDSGRWSGKLLAIRDLLAAAADNGIQSIGRASSANNSDRLVALYEIAAALADLHLYLDALGRAHATNGIIL